MEMAEKTLRTGQVAAAAGVNVETLRYYERRGILKEPRRRGSGFRAYPPEAVKIVRFVKTAQELGFTLDEIEELLSLRDDHQRSCADVRAAATTKIEDVDQKIEKLHAMKQALTVLVNSCRGKGSTRECPILEAIDAKAGGDHE